LHYCYINQACGDISHTIGPFKIQFNTNEYFSVDADTFAYQFSDVLPGMQTTTTKCVFGVMRSDLATKNNEFILG